MRAARPEVELRRVREDDIEVFFEHQADPVAARMAVFPSRAHDEHRSHWAGIMDDDRSVTRTIVVDGEVAGNVGSWEAEGDRLVGYWIGRAFWGRGVATAALSSFLALLPDRPIRARVAKSNPGSIRVLEKCGFEVIGERRDGEVEELLYELGAAT